MKLVDYIDNLNTLMKEFGEDLEVVYAKDSEGNGFDLVSYTPSVGHFDNEEKDFVGLDNLDEYNLDASDVDSVCLN